MHSDPAITRTATWDDDTDVEIWSPPLPAAPAPRRARRETQPYSFVPTTVRVTMLV